MNKLQLIFTLAIPLTIIDQITKILTFKYLQYPSVHLPPNSYSLPIIPNFLDFTCSLNTGVAFGMGQDKNIFFSILTSVIILVMVYFYKKIAVDKLSTIGFGMVLSGAVGNLIDRVFYNAVRDFIDVHWYSHHWPIFNIADSCISVGVGLLLISSYFEEKRKKDVS